VRSFYRFGLKKRPKNRIGPSLGLAESWAELSLSFAASPIYNPPMYAVEIEREEDGRWIAEVPELPGVLAYGQTREEALRKAQALSLRVLAERLEHGEALPQVENVFSIVA
jgi:predicted RNase H-like HicB family nuclease